MEWEYGDEAGGNGDDIGGMGRWEGMVERCMGWNAECATCIPPIIRQPSTITQYNNNFHQTPAGYMYKVRQVMGVATYTGTGGKPLGTDQGHVCLRWPHGPALNVALVPGTG